MRTRTIVLAAIVLATLWSGSAALAKGPAGATIEGAGVDGVLTIYQAGELGQGTAMSRLVEAAGFFELTFGESKAVLTGAPTDALAGPRLVIAWDMGTGDTITEEIYLGAEGGPVAFVEPDQEFWRDDRTGDSYATIGGWYRITRDIEAPLIELGVGPDTFGKATASDADASATKEAGSEAITKAEPAPVKSESTPNERASAATRLSSAVTPTGPALDPTETLAIVLGLAFVAIAAGGAFRLRLRRPVPH